MLTAVTVARGAILRSALLAALASSCASSRGTSSGALVGQSQPSPRPIELALETTSGDTLELATLRGRAVLVVAFNHDDLRSHATLREAERVARAHPDSLAVVAVCGNPGSFRTLRTLLEAFAHVLELERTVVVVASDAVRDGTSPLGPVPNVPTTILINRAGIVSRTVIGLLTQREIEAIVRPALPPGG